MSVATLTNTGQLTIPKNILSFLGVKTGDKINFLIEKDRVVLQNQTLDVRELKGILKRKTNKIVSIEEMNAAIISGVTGESK